jgi:hypothetical protein
MRTRTSRVVSDIPLTASGPSPCGPRPSSSWNAATAVLGARAVRAPAGNKSGGDRGAAHVRARQPVQIASSLYPDRALARARYLYIFRRKQYCTIRAAAHSTWATDTLLEFAGGYTALIQHLGVKCLLCVFWQRGLVKATQLTHSYPVRSRSLWSRSWV